jgi:hypothetical protein
MEAVSWPDAGVAAWTKEHATLRSVDLDHDPEMRDRYGVSAIPTLVVIGARGEELARSTGFLSGPDLLEFLEQSRTGVSRLSQLEAKLAGSDASAAPAVHMDILREAVRTRNWTRAALAWDSAWSARDCLDADDRVGMIGCARRIGPDAGEASAAVERSRRALGDPTPAPGADADTGVTWAELSLALDRADEVATWYSADPGEASRRAVLAGDYDAAWSAFVRTRRADDLIRLFTGDDPARYAQRSLADDAVSGPGVWAFNRTSMLRQHQLPRVLDLYGACVAAGRADEGAGVRRAAEDRFGAESIRDDLERAVARWTAGMPALDRTPPASP